MLNMREKLLLFILKFVGASLVLFIFWFWKIQSFYLLVFKNFVEFLGMDFKIPELSILLFSNFIPFASLMIITRGLNLEERLKKLGWGVLILFIWHVMSTEIFYSIRFKPQLNHTLVPIFYLFSISLPFFLWLIFFRKKLKGLFVLG